MNLTTSESIASLAGALAKAQAEIESAAKDRVNPHFKSKYATLASVWEACRSALSKNGVSVIQSPMADGNIVTVTTLLAHASGEWARSALSAAAVNATPQGIGSAVTYLRRYSLAAMVGVAPDDDEDDDGNQQGYGREPERPRASAPPRPAPPAANDVPEAEVEKLRAAIKEAATPRDLEGLTPRIHRLPDDLKGSLRAPYENRLAELRGKKGA